MNKLNELKMTKEQIAKILLESIREVLNEITQQEDLHSTAVTGLYTEPYCEKIKEYKAKTLKSILLLSVNSPEPVANLEEIKDFLDTVDLEQKACEFLLECIQQYAVGNEDELNYLLSTPLTDREKNNIFIIQTLLCDLLNVLSNPSYKKDARDIVVNRLGDFAIKQKEEIDYLKTRMDEIQVKLQNLPIKENNEIDQTMKQILEFCGKTSEDIDSYMESRKNFKETKTAEDGIKSLNMFSQAVFGRNLITKEIWDKVAKGVDDGTLQFNEESIKKIIEEIEKNVKTEE